MKQHKEPKPAHNAPSSGQGSSSALEAMIRKRIPTPAPHVHTKAAPPKKS